MSAAATIGLASHRLATPLHTRTGLGRYQMALTEALAAHGHHRYILLAPREAHQPAWTPMPVVRVGGTRAVVQARWALRGRPYLDRLARGVDLVHVLDATVPAATVGPLVHTIHDLFLLEKTPERSLRSHVLFLAVLRAIRRATRIITPSRAIAAEVVDRLQVDAGRVVVIPEGVDERFRVATPTRTLPRGVEPDGYWLAVGRPTARKNFGVLLDAVARAASHRPLLVAGPHGPETAALTARAAQLGIRDRLVLLGFVADDELPGLVAGARALLHPARAEGFGLPPLEAMAAATPVVVAPSAAVLEVVADAGLTCDADDPGAWARSLRRLEDDQALVADLGAAGKTRAAVYDWVATATATDAVYDQCLR